MTKAIFIALIGIHVIGCGDNATVEQGSNLMEPIRPAAEIYFDLANCDAAHSLSILLETFRSFGLAAVPHIPHDPDGDEASIVMVLARKGDIDIVASNYSDRNVLAIRFVALDQHSEARALSLEIKEALSNRFPCNDS